MFILRAPPCLIPLADVVVGVGCCFSLDFGRVFMLPAAAAKATFTIGLSTRVFVQVRNYETAAAAGADLYSERKNLHVVASECRRAGRRRRLQRRAKIN